MEMDAIYEVYLLTMYCIVWELVWRRNPVPLEQMLPLRSAHHCRLLSKSKKKISHLTSRVLTCQRSTDGRQSRSSRHMACDDDDDDDDEAR
jgi:hypothetical protein